ncbi:MAG: hypothetical protein M3O03_02915 [Pseudomonadota bacterium]|nr:hypothetical protein [Pseudomonadota bacterium]
MAFIALAFSFVAALAQDKPVPSAAPQLLSEISLDLDGDGISDRVALVLTGSSGTVEKRDDGSYRLNDGESVDLFFYMHNGDKTLDLSARATFVKKNVLGITNVSLLETVFPLAQRGKAAVAFHSCYGCSASISWDETLTLVSRNQQFLVAGYGRSWFTNTHPNPPAEDISSGRCDINFLTGKGLAANDIEAQVKPLKQKFHLIKLADWSRENSPADCN